MAIVVNQQPTNQNVTSSPILFNVSSALYVEPQFQYLCDIKDSTDTLLVRIKQYPNPAGTATFDVSRILNDYLEWSPDNFKISGSYGLEYTDEYKNFIIKFGEEYGPSLSANVTIYDGNGVAGNPIITGSNSPYYAFQGIVDPNNGIGWNFGDVFGTASIDAIALTNHPNSGQYTNNSENRDVTITDYGIMGVYDPDGSAPPYTYKLYNSSNTLITSSVLDLSNSGSYMNYIPTGPSNLLEMGFSQGDLDNTTRYEIEYNTNLIAKYNLDLNCNYERTNFLFVNSFGVWDHYGMNLPVRKGTTIDRKEITNSNVQWSASQPTYNSSNRGRSYYDVKSDDDYVVTTPFLTQDKADFVRELLESPNAFLQVENTKLKYSTTNSSTVFVPIIITNSSYVWRTNPRGQKVFQYDIQFKYSNQRYHN